MPPRQSLSGYKSFFYLSAALFICSLTVFGLVSVRALPERIVLCAESFDNLNMRGPMRRFFSAQIEETTAIAVTAQLDAPYLDSTETLRTAEISLSAFGIPIRNISVDILPDVEVIPIGLTVGIRMDIVGLVVLRTGIITLADGSLSRPSEGLIKPGDVILKIDGVEVTGHAQFSAYLDSLPQGSKVNLAVKRSGQIFDIPVKTAVSADDGKNRLGLYIRDSAKGIGTITYYNPANSRFAALGHGVVDVDTKQLLPVKGGRLYQTDIVAVKKGRSGSPGELIGEVNTNNAIGVITENTAVGLYGTINTAHKQISGDKVRIALQGEVTEGPAVILSSAGGREVRQYDIFIERVNRFASDSSKGMVILVTDKDLLTRTNGIVQGMSGCPIIQNGRLVGAVTHVFLQNPQRGYGIFIENMVKKEQAF